jgi:hypothetical protein
MLQTRSRGYSTGAACILGLAGFMASAGASAQEAWGYLVRQDFSDCQNQNVNASNPNMISGTIGAVRNNGGGLSVKVGITGSVNTRYNFYLKCVRQLGIIKTDDEGSGVEVFDIPAGDVKPIITFDMYPDGAPAGNKFQSTQVKF